MANCAWLAPNPRKAPHTGLLVRTATASTSIAGTRYGPLAWPAMLACAAIWGVTLFLSRISSVSSLVSVVAAPLVAWGLGYPEVIPPLIAIAAIVIVQHRANIGRLMRGEEPKVGSSGKS